MFRSDRQIALTCRALCAGVRRRDLWSADGPSEEAIALMETNGGGLSSGECVVVMTAWAVWNGHSEARLADILNRLDGKNLKAIGTLLVAMGSGAAAISGRRTARAKRPSC